MKSSWQRKLPAKRSIKPNAGQSKNPKDDTHLRGGERGLLTRDFKIATVPAPLRCRCLRRLLHHLTWTTNCSKCFRRLISITFKLRFRFWFFNFTVFFSKSFALKLVQPAAVWRFRCQLTRIRCIFWPKTKPSSFRNQQQQQQDICFNWMDNLATAMTSKAGCLDQLTARNSHGLYSRSLEQNVQRLAGLFLRQTNKIKNTNRPKDKKQKKKMKKKKEKTTAIKPKYNRNCEKLHFEFFHSPLSLSFWGN